MDLVDAEVAQLLRMESRWRMNAVNHQIRVILCFEKGQRMVNELALG